MCAAVWGREATRPGCELVDLCGLGCEGITVPLPRLAALCPNLAFLAPLASTQELLEVVKEVKGRYLVTADHGNADDMAQVVSPAADSLPC